MNPSSVMILVSGATPASLEAETIDQRTARAPIFAIAFRGYVEGQQLGIGRPEAATTGRIQSQGEVGIFHFRPEIFLGKAADLAEILPPNEDAVGGTAGDGGRAIGIEPGLGVADKAVEAIGFTAIEAVPALAGAAEFDRVVFIEQRWRYQRGTVVFGQHRGQGAQPAGALRQDS